MRLASSAGPVLLFLGLAGLTAIFLQPPDSRGTLGWWILSNIYAYQRVLPLAGLGIALALVSLSQCIAALSLFALGIALGLIFSDSLLSMISLIPGAVENHFLTGPIMSIAVGLSLIAPGRIRGWVLPVAAIIAGTIFACAIRLTDPSYHDPTIALTGIGVGVWIMMAMCLTLRAFRQTWFGTAGRILGSWLIAIGLLYGGASLVPPRDVAPLDQPETSPSPQNVLTGPPPDTALPVPDQSDRLPSPGGFDPTLRP